MAKRVYIGRNNEVVLQLKSGLPGQPLEVQNLGPAGINLTAVELRLSDGTAIYSDTSSASGPFDWTSDPELLVIKVGLVPAIDGKVGVRGAYLIVFSAQWPEGKVWLSNLDLVPQKVPGD